MEQTLRAVKFSSGARHRCFNFSSYYLNETLSDVTILIRIAVNGNSNIPGRAVVQRLPGHGVVLSNGEAADLVHMPHQPIKAVASGDCSSVE